MSDPTKRGVSTVMSRMKTFIQDENTYSPEFVSVAGDNYYPNKPEKKTKKDKTAEKDKSEVKQKVIIKSELDSGFACLKSLNVPVNVILGNHDLETNRENKHSFLIDDKEAESCEILNLETQITKPTKHGVKLQLDFLTEGEIPFIGTNTMVLMIDTSMYETKLEDIAQYAECYQKLEDPLKIEQLRDRQQLRVINAITQNQSKSNIVLIGHHPITAYIVKKNEYQLVKPFRQFVELWKAIIAKTKEETTGKHLYYLCADKHFYQPGTVKIEGTEIHQYIVGTGGADLDKNPFDITDMADLDTNPPVDKKILIENMATDIEKVTYSMTNEQIGESVTNYGYGFLVCTETPEELVFQFVPDTSTPKLSEKLQRKKEYAKTRNRNASRTQSASPFSRSRRSQRSRPSSVGGTRKLYRRKRK
jgi:hypothetical protein